MSEQAPQPEPQIGVPTWLCTLVGKLVIESEAIRVDLAATQRQLAEAQKPVGEVKK